MNKAKFWCITKATNREESNTLRSPKTWAFPKRGILKFYENYFSLGAWTFDFITIKNPTLYTLKGSILPKKVLTFDYKDEHYQFTLNPWVNPTPHFPFPLRKEEKTLKMMTFTTVTRIIVIALIIYLLFFK